MENLPILTTSRLLLRAFTKSDWPEVHQYDADPEVARYMPFDPLNEATSREFLDQAINGPNNKPPAYHFAVVVKSTLKLIGGCSIAIRYDELHQGELFFLYNRQYWGQGYGTEAAQAVLRFGFEQLGLHRIFATCRPENVGSYRVLEKLDMRREGHLRQHRWMKGQWWDSYLYALLEHEWRFKNDEI